ncbi:MAG TPA: CsgG/HfaB family protein [Vicinamibacteria bacterium]|nr:CsgG/HfaB family protein [Vicinamibacteria bacterium]
MMKSFRLALAFVLAGALVPATIHAQGKIRIAIWDFENNAERSWWFYDDLGPAARNHIDTAFSENETLSQQFSIIEREKLDMVMKEQGLATSGALDQQTAAKVGQILGVKYILTGGIDKFAINTTKGGFGGIGGSYTKAEATINLRLIDTTTAERLVAVAADGDVKKGGGVFKGASLSREDEWGIASEAIEAASAKVVAAFAESKSLGKLSAGGVMAGVEGKIIKIEGNQAWINMGEMSGIKVGDTFAVVSVGEELVDPDTGAVLGADESETGEGQVVDVKDRFSIMTFTGAAKAADIVRKK